MTPALAAAGFYAGLAMMLTIVLQGLVIRRRMTQRVSLGTGADGTLERLVRIHGNYVENAPFVIIGMVILALQGFASVTIHMIGGAFIAVRIAHAIGLARTLGVNPGRTVGVLGTQLIMLFLAGAMIGRFLGWV